MRKFVLSHSMLAFLAISTTASAQINSGIGSGFGGGTGGTGANGSLLGAMAGAGNAAGAANGLLGSGSSFSGFTQNFGNGNSPFNTGGRAWAEAMGLERLQHNRIKVLLG